MKHFLFILFLPVSMLHAQITAPDFTLTDIHGNNRNLYSETDAGKTVVLDFFSIYCGTCITNTPVLETIWQTHGHQGDSLWVWGIESFGAPDSSIINFENTYHSTFPIMGTSSDDVVIYLYNITYTPQYFVVCPDRSMKPYAIGDIESGIQNCIITASASFQQQPQLHVFAQSNTLIINGSFEKTERIRVDLFSATGQTYYTERSIAGGTTEIPVPIKTPVLFYRISGEKGTLLTSGKVYLEL